MALKYVLEFNPIQAKLNGMAISLKTGNKLTSREGEPRAFIEPFSKL